MQFNYKFATLDYALNEEQMQSILLKKIKKRKVFQNDNFERLFAFTIFFP